MTLEEYLRKTNKSAFEIRSFVDEDGEVTFYIHANEISDDMLSFKVDGNYLTRI